MPPAARHAAPDAAVLPRRVDHRPAGQADAAGLDAVVRDWTRVSLLRARWMLPARQWAAVVATRPEAVLEHVADEVSAAHLAWCVAKAPAAALQFAADRLSPAQWRRCVRRAPGAAVTWHAAALSGQELAWCVAMAPAQALAAAGDRLTPVQRQWCVVKSADG